MLCVTKPTFRKRCNESGFLNREAVSNVRLAFQRCVIEWYRPP